MATLWKSARGFVVQWESGRDRTGNRRRSSRTFCTEAEAIAHKLKVERAAFGAGKEDLETRGLEWVESRLALSKITAKTAMFYREKLSGWAALLGSGPVKKLSARAIADAYGKLARGQTPSGRVPSPRTLHHYRRALSTFFSHLEKAREIEFNPCRGLESPAGLERRTKRAPTRAELAAIIAEAERSGGAFGQLSTFIRLGAHTGLRRGELAALRWEDCDLDAGRIAVNRAATQPDGGEVTFKAPKSAAGLRTVAIMPQTVDLLWAQRRLVLERRLAAGSAWADNDLVFCSPVGEVLSLANLTRQAGEARDRAGVPREVMPLHGQRHYALTELHRAGVDVLTMRRRAGHASLASTQGYVTVDEDMDRIAAEKARESLL